MSSYRDQQVPRTWKFYFGPEPDPETNEVINKCNRDLAAYSWQDPNAGGPIDKCIRKLKANRTRQRAKAKQKNAETGGAKPEKDIATPFVKMLVTLSRSYSAKCLNKIKPHGAPPLLEWVRRTRDELNALEIRILDKFGPQSNQQNNE